MEAQKKALMVTVIAVAVLAAAMYFFYFVKDRTRKADSDVDLNQKVEQVKEEKSEFVGIYSPQAPMEASGKRISYFQVNRKEDGGYLGAAKLDTIGSSESTVLNCVDVKIEEKSFYLKCVDPAMGMVSLDGQWAKTASGTVVNGHVLWAKDGTPFVDQDNQFTLAPN
jgi:hypothetical protein